MTKTKLIFVGLAVALVGFLFAGSASAQDQTLTANGDDPHYVAEPGTYEITLNGAGYTLSSVNFVTCGTSDMDAIIGPAGGAGLIAECGGFGAAVDLEADGTWTNTVEVEIGEAGIAFGLFELRTDGEGAFVQVIVDADMAMMDDDMLADTGVETSLLVIIGAGIALAGLMVFGLSRRLRTL
ncbi:MAG: hypothetical protein OXG30_08365 [bacterium]|nr:hypothetical protein [bacterium]